MVKIDTLLAEGKISKIPELELERYITFFEHSSIDNLAHGHAVLATFPRWSIISGYYAMHDRTKLLLARLFRLKIELEVHATAIKVLREVLHNQELLALMEKAYKEFLSLANDLADAKQERVNTQYFTGTVYSVEQYKQRAEVFLEETVIPFLVKINLLIGEKP